MSAAFTNPPIRSYRAPTAEQFATLSKTSDEAVTNTSQHVIDTLVEFSKNNHVWVLARPVNPSSLLHMKDQAVPDDGSPPNLPAQGKNFFIHGKSADEGPANGLIPVNASISKAGKTPDINKTKAYQHENDHSLERSEETFIELQERLQITAAQLPEAERKPENIMKKAGISEDHFAPLVEKMQLTDKSGRQIYIFTDTDKLAAKGEDGKHIYAIQNEDKTFSKIDENHNVVGPYLPPATHKAEAVEVWGKPTIEVQGDGTLRTTEVRAITADVDIMAYAARIDLTPGTIRNFDQHVMSQKQAVIKESGLIFPEETRKNLATKPLSEMQEYINTISEDFTKGQALIKALQAVETQSDKDLQHLRGMGDGGKVIHDITGFLRSELKRDEISHGSEQFNYDATQPLDKEWILYKPDGSITKITSETRTGTQPGLLDIFSEAKRLGYSMPPNPTWGWKLQSGEYQRDETLKEQNKLIDPLMFVKTEDAVQQQAINNILDQRKKLGLVSIGLTEKGLSDEERTERTTKLKTDLDNSIKEYGKKYLIRERQEDDLEITSVQRRQSEAEDTHIQRMKEGQNSSYASVSGSYASKRTSPKISPSTTRRETLLPIAEAPRIPVEATKIAAPPARQAPDGRVRSPSLQTSSPIIDTRVDRIIGSLCDQTSQPKAQFIPRINIGQQKPHTEGR